MDSINIERLTLKYMNKRGKYRNVDRVDTLEVLKSAVIQLESITQSLKRNQDNQVQRMIECFKKHDYERRFKVDLATVLGVILGEENVFREMLKQRRKERQLEID